MTMDILKNKRALVLGVANENSIGWGIANCLKEAGASVALTFQNDALAKRVEPLASKISADFICQMDVEKEEDYSKLSQKIKEEWGSFDILIHSLAYAERDDLKKRFSDIGREGFIKACDISAFSLVRLAGELKPFLSKDASIVAMSYVGSQRVLSNYSVMGVAKAALESSIRYLADDLGKDGIRVNGISAGAIRTLAASGISGAREMIRNCKEKSPMRDSVNINDVGKTAIYLASDLSSKVTGQIVYVDSGFSILGS